VLHLGDIVDGGREAQYPIYLETRRTITKPIHEIAGNHDPLPLFEKYIRPTGDLAVDHDWLRVLLLHNARVDSHDGFLSDDQLDWIDDQCAAAAGDDRLVALAMHVPAHANGHPDRGWFVHPADGQTRLYETLSRHADRVLALLHGHFHNGIRGWDDHPPVHEICFPSALYNQDRGLEAQDAPGYNPVEFRPGFTLVDIDGPALRLRYVAVGAESDVEKTLPLGPQ
jgi:3',5'-cyclic AMP phosphodiesterase CpdA